MPVDTGYLRESVSMDFKKGGLTGVINIGSEYAVYVNYGTGIYAVGPGGSRAKNIPWRYKDADGHWHTTKGQHAQPFGNLQSMKVERFSISIFHKVVKICGYQ